MKLSKEKQDEFNKQLQELALQKFDLFCQITGADIELAYVCTQVSKGRTHSSIAKSLGVKRQSVTQRCKRCPKM
jgi:hypothetical protein